MDPEMKMRNDERPIIGITMGDPAGNGPEITVKALADETLYVRARPIVIGDAKMIRQAAGFVGRPDIRIHVCENVADAFFTPGVIDVLHLDLIKDVEKFEVGKVSIEGGNAAFQCVKKVIELALAGEVDATVTNALSKEAMNMALEADKGAHSDGYTHFDGHTEPDACSRCNALAVANELSKRFEGQGVDVYALYYDVLEGSVEELASL